MSDMLCTAARSSSPRAARARDHSAMSSNHTSPARARLGVTPRPRAAAGAARRGRKLAIDRLLSRTARSLVVDLVRGEGRGVSD